MSTATLSKLLPDAATHAATRYGRAVALICEGRPMSYGELDARAAWFATYLLRAGIRAGDRVTLWAPNSAEWLVAYHGVLRAGAVINPLNALLTPEEVVFAATDCGARLLLIGADRAARAAELRALCGIEHVLLVGDDAGDGFATIAQVSAGLDAVSPVGVAPDAPAAILYTSGTTGRPKGAVLSQQGLLLNAQLTAQMHARTSSDVVVSALPLPHVYGAVVAHATLLTGGCLVPHAQFKADEILKSIYAHRATMFEGVPTMYHYLLACPEIERYDTSSLTRCTVGGQTMPVPKMQEVERRLGCPLLELWGMTELGGLGTTHEFPAPARLGSIGVPLPGMQARIAPLESTSAGVFDGKVGELCMRGPLVMRGYYGNEGATRECIDADGWLHTGDLAYQDADGYLFIVDRKKDLIITGGYNVYPAEIERVIAEHPAVAMVAVGAVPDEVKGELAKAYIVPRGGNEVTEEEIAEYCRARLASYKCPRQIQFVSDLPKTSTGKIMRRALQSAAPCSQSSCVTEGGIP